MCEDKKQNFKWFFKLLTRRTFHKHTTKMNPQKKIKKKKKNNTMKTLIKHLETQTDNTLPPYEQSQGIYFQ